MRMIRAYLAAHDVDLPLECLEYETRVTGQELRQLVGVEEVGPAAPGQLQPQLVGIHQLFFAEEIETELSRPGIEREHVGTLLPGKGTPVAAEIPQALEEELKTLVALRIRLVGEASGFERVLGLAEAPVGVGQVKVVPPVLGTAFHDQFVELDLRPGIFVFELPRLLGPLAWIVLVEPTGQLSVGVDVRSGWELSGGRRRVQSAHSNG